MHINNVPAYAEQYKYWVVRDCGKDGLWFWGSYRSVNTARAICKTIGNGRLYIPGMKHTISKDSI